LQGAKLARAFSVRGSCSRSTVVRTQRPHEIVVQRLDEWRYALAVDGIVRYVGSEEECQRRLAMLVPNNDRAGQDEALGRLWRIMH
jgi:hypothetical protein